MTRQARPAKATSNRWARLSVGYHRDPKIIEVGAIGELAFLRLLALAREVVESMDNDGAIPYVLAARELREVAELFTLVHPGKTFDDLLVLLSDVSLIRREDKTIIVCSYTDWQTTRKEIDAAREEGRERVAAFRKRKAEAAAPHDDAEKVEDMGVYDTEVTAFADLRDSGAIKIGNRKIGKNGLNPNQVEDAERIIAHLSAARKELLGAGFKITATWWSDVKRLLSGTGESPAFTADQVCDLMDFGLHHKFWHTHCQTPAGYVKQGSKLFYSDEYIAWSKKNNRPEANRPRNTIIGDSGPANFRGTLAADKAVDWANVSEEL